MGLLLDLTSNHYPVPLKLIYIIYDIYSSMGIKICLYVMRKMPININRVLGVIRVFAVIRHIGFRKLDGQDRLLVDKRHHMYVSCIAQTQSHRWICREYPTVLRNKSCVARYWQPLNQNNNDCHVLVVAIFEFKPSFYVGSQSRRVTLALGYTII
jgi:hypothetical protein